MEIGEYKIMYNNFHFFYAFVVLSLRAQMELFQAAV
jgi:hypothetical protein